MGVRKRTEREGREAGEDEFLHLVITRTGKVKLTGEGGRKYDSVETAPSTLESSGSLISNLPTYPFTFSPPPLPPCSKPPFFPSLSLIPDQEQDLHYPPPKKK